jgi:hypothetical protein
MVSATQPIKLTSLFLPKHAGLETWRVWSEMEGEEIFWFGAEVSKADEITPFAED